MRRAIFLVVLLLAVAAPSRAELFRPANAREGKLQALDCLIDCAFSSEYGNPNSRLLRWKDPIYVYAGGSPTAEDLRQLDGFLMELSFRVPLLPPVERVFAPEAANLTLYFVPEARMGDYVKDYVSGNWGFVTYFYNNYVINRAEVAVASDVTNQKQRNGIIREEIVNGLGLGNDHYRFEDSIIYEPYNEAETLSEVDWLMLNMVYSPLTRPGMGADEAYRALKDEILK